MHTASNPRSAADTSGFIEARVTGAGTEVLGLSTPAGSLTARRAASCLLEPSAGDTVLTVCGADGAWYVLAVLTRGEASAVVSLPADSTIRTQGGGLTLAASTELALAAGKRASITTPELEVHAERAHASFGVLNVVAGLIDATATRVRSLADVFETVADCIRQRAGSMYREVKDLDHLKAGQVYYKSESVFNVRGKHSVLSAEGEVKIDGTRVHLG